MLSTRYISFVLFNGPAMKKVFSTLLILIFFNGLCYAAEPTAIMSEPGWITESRASIKAKKYEQAIEQLKSANASISADWNNLLGYALRKKQPPDLAGAEIYYEAAIKIDPKHRGAL